ncbi:MAG: hypothetical protein VR64_07310 [Desulfatitalea sp. BRH_c12]|nr:MAG: hypothetical protein VR64_07310 [Desulfatitalea sp. BRH_c12]
MLSLTDIPDFRHFLSSLLVKASKNEIAELNQLFETTETPWFEKLAPTAAITKASFWFEHLSSYSIISTEIFDDLPYRAPVNVTMENHKGTDIFDDLGFLIINTNYGIMVLFFNRTGSIERLELNFRVEKRMPPFLSEFLKHFPNEDPRLDRKIRNQIKKTGTLPIADYLRTFRRKRLRTIEVD